MSAEPKITPMLRQYLEIKKQHPDAILFYRMGDFYEMFFEDALLAAPLLGIALTSRSHKDEASKIPMCGVPYHALNSYLGKMIQAGHRVALCEQVEDPKNAKGIVRREVTRVVSPGLNTEEQLLDAKAEAFICALYLHPASGKESVAGMAFLDLSTGRFQVSEVRYSSQHEEELLETLCRMRPLELLLSERLAQEAGELMQRIQTRLGPLCLTVQEESAFHAATAHTTLTEHFHTLDLAGFGCDGYGPALQAAGALLAHIQTTQKSASSHINRIGPLVSGELLLIDEASRRNLELTETLNGGTREGSLLALLDQSKTAMGARRLRRWLLFPLQDAGLIEARLDAVEELSKHAKMREELAALLATVADLERLCGRLALNQGSARDLNSIRQSISRLPQLKEALAPCQAQRLAEMATGLDPLQDLHDLIAASVREDAPLGLKDGGLIKEGYHAELDRLIVLLRDGKQLILELEAKERQRSGLAKLKVGYNRVFGYYFELSRSQAQTLPDYFIRKQTLVNAERFITPELKELEEAISSAQEKRLDLEQELFLDIRAQIANHSQRLLAVADQLARLDALMALAECATRFRYCRPRLNNEGRMEIIEGRHPVIERALAPGSFTPNDLRLDHEQNLLLIITGPNMAGKSTILRQTALIVLMAQMGGFVPAESADLCLVDRIFTRVGAMDNLRRGQSTFMVEMNETANILNNASDRSLVIMDEIGRGTSTHDGLAIAWAVAEALLRAQGRGVKTLFATHYHELIDLARSEDKAQNYSIAVKEWQGRIIFLHRLTPGGASRSYGIQVASLAGVPSAVIERANEILQSIEQQHQGGVQIKDDAQGLKPEQNPSPSPSALASLFAAIDPDQLSARQALDLVYQATQLAQEKNGQTK